MSNIPLAVEIGMITFLLAVAFFIYLFYLGFIDIDDDDDEIDSEERS